MTFADLARRAAKLAIDNSPTILTSFAVVGAVSTAYLAGKASFQASDAIRHKEAEDDDRGIVQPDPREVMKERVQLVWRLYIPSMVMGTATVVCIIGANQIGMRRAASLAAAYTLTEKTLDEYRAKVVEKIGERKEQAINDEIAQDRVSESYSEDLKIYGAPSGELCYDMYSDRYFWATVEDIKRAQNELNFALLHDHYASLSEFYDKLGLPPTGYSEEVGWNMNQQMEVKISTTLTSAQKPCIAISFRVEPVRNYFRFS